MIEIFIQKHSIWQFLTDLSNFSFYCRGSLQQKWRLHWLSCLNQRHHHGNLGSTREFPAITSSIPRQWDQCQRGKVRVTWRMDYTVNIQTKPTTHCPGRCVARTGIWKGHFDMEPSTLYRGWVVQLLVSFKLRVTTVELIPYSSMIKWEVMACI